MTYPLDFSTDSNLPFVMGKIKWRTGKKQDVVNRALDSVASSLDFVATADTSDLPTRDDDHFNNEALLYEPLMKHPNCRSTLGERMAAAYIQLHNK